MKNSMPLVVVLLSSLVTITSCAREEIYSTTYSKSNYFRPSESDAVTSGYNRDFNKSHHQADADDDAGENIGKGNDTDDHEPPKLGRLD